VAGARFYWRRTPAADGLQGTPASGRFIRHGRACLLYKVHGRACLLYKVHDNGGDTNTADGPRKGSVVFDHGRRPLALCWRRTPTADVCCCAARGCAAAKPHWWQTPIFHWGRQPDSTGVQRPQRTSAAAVHAAAQRTTTQHAAVRRPSPRPPARCRGRRRVALKAACLPVSRAREAVATTHTHTHTHTHAHTHTPTHPPTHPHPHTHLAVVEAKGGGRVQHHYIYIYIYTYIHIYTPGCR
jgi:hypothetical protein